MRIYIDVKTGVWGDPESIKFMELPEDMIEAFGELNDNNRINSFYENLRELTASITAKE